MKTAKEFWNTQVPTDANKTYVSDFWASKFDHKDMFRFAEAYAALAVEEATKDYYPKEFVIAFIDWLDKLQPSQRTSVWSKDGQYNGLFTMDNEQLLAKFKERVWKENEQ